MQLMRKALQGTMVRVALVTRLEAVDHIVELEGHAIVRDKAHRQSTE